MGTLKWNKFEKDRIREKMGRINRSRCASNRKPYWSEFNYCVYLHTKSERCLLQGVQKYELISGSFYKGRSRSIVRKYIFIFKRRSLKYIKKISIFSKCFQKNLILYKFSLKVVIANYDANVFSRYQYNSAIAKKYIFLNSERKRRNS